MKLTNTKHMKGIEKQNFVVLPWRRTLNMLAPDIELLEKITLTLKRPQY
jgi:hypothetical protein